MKSWFSLFLCLSGLAFATFAGDPLSVQSPDDRIALSFTVATVDGESGCPVYSVNFRGTPVIVPSRLGLELKDGALLAGFRIAETKTSASDETWSPVCGPSASVRDQHHQLDVTLVQTNPPGRRLVLTFRVSNEGVAFNYTLPAQDGRKAIEITKERSEFRFAADHEAWPTYAAQGAYAATPLSKIKPDCERPLVVKAGQDVYVALAEAKLVEHARMKFDPIAGAFGVVSRLAGPCTYENTMTTPWRVVMLADRPGALVENNFLLLNLNDPCALADTSWIKPGKAIRETTLTTVGGKACVDFAVKRGLQYIEFDAGWYGYEYDAKSGASAVNLDPKRSKGPLDLQEVVRYAASKDIGVILYVNHLAAEKQLDQILPLYRSWGIKGVKYGFVNVGAQKWTSWLHEAIRKASLCKLMVDVHDEYRPTGYSRTYPNLMTTEGVRGDEETPPAEQTLAGAFIRTIAGPADHTVCYFDGRVVRAWTHAYQLAKPVCIFSGWQFLFWYDRPDKISQDEPELAFWNHMPATWDETHVLEGEIGRDIVVARRKGAEWFVGGMNAGDPRTFETSLAFLPRGKKFVAEIYRHDPTLSSATKVRADRFGVDSTSVLKTSVFKADGFAVRLVPLGATDKVPAYPQ